MKNGIILNGITYKVCKNKVGVFLPFDTICKICAFKKRCDKGSTRPCALFEDKNHEVYFKKTSNKE